MNTHTSTFEVSSVPRAIEPLPEVPYRDAIDQLLNKSLRNSNQQLQELKSHLQEWVDSLQLPETDDQGDVEERLELARIKQQIAAYEDGVAIATRAIESCSGCQSRLVADVLGHPVINSLHRAFAQHRPLCLSPDMIWLLICQGLAHHVNVNAENLRSRFVRHEGKKRIVVTRDDFIKGSPENPWGDVIAEFSRQVREYVGAAQDLFVPRFSTTGPTERIAAEIVCLDAVQSYFDYVLSSICGIPAITLEGTVADWQELADRAQAFAQFDLEWWLTPLQPILQEFVAAARGEVRRSFWKSIYNFGSFSGGAAITGWIIAFFPYLKDKQGNPTKKNVSLTDDSPAPDWKELTRQLLGEGKNLSAGLDARDDPMETNPWLAETSSKSKRLLAGVGPSPFEGLSPGAFPSGLARAPFVWNYFGQELDMEFIGGFVGVAQDPATLALRPEIGWAIR